MHDATIIEWIRGKFQHLVSDLDERGRRRWAAVEAISLGWGGISAVAEATGISDRTIRTGIQELNATDPLGMDRQRCPGGGRKPHAKLQSSLASSLDELINPTTRGDPMSALRWTCKSTRTLAEELKKQGYQVGPSTVRVLLAELGYSLQANRKTREGKQHPERDAQFRHIHARVQSQQRLGGPAISVDTKKKELVGNKKNPGQTYEPKGKPREVDTHDFPDKKKGKAVPYGIYDIHRNEAAVSVGISHDTAEFAVSAIDRWWKNLGRKNYLGTKRLLITADCGGSNSVRARLWKFELQRFADKTGMVLEVCHYPPGTSKWNKIEHRVFCHITRNWQGVPLETYEIVVALIAGTTTETGLEIHVWLDESTCEKGREVSDEELDACLIVRNKFQGEWNYEIHPRKLKIR
jgi:transposase